MDFIDNLILDKMNNLSETAVAALEAPAAVRKDPYNQYLQNFGQLKPTYRELIDYDYIGRIRDFFMEFFWRGVLGDYSFHRSLGIKLASMMNNIPVASRIFYGFNIRDYIFGPTKADWQRSEKSLGVVEKFGISSPVIINIKNRFKSNGDYQKRFIQDVFIGSIYDNDSVQYKKLLSDFYRTDKNHKIMVDALVDYLRAIKDKNKRLNKIFKMFFTLK